ncbi:GAP family protein [Mycolicibacterium brumae]|uniref:GAP family protein n=1 Tax=Mycolicibacterium brumae TaxID=85968 RepID=A0A2G5PGK4_9MYCO|nr:GAP family protein [Mycolicibacterium brumae]MCV7192621.1 GAP family protein [Mycolicibacterium brumae]PIB77280.1 GAP family protein [Mycolicibacterium brumae]UWW10391.1 GAP family protein [Mycolicibacterium brumae]
MSSPSGPALTELIPLALVIALSPLTIIPIVGVLHSPRPRPGSVAYLAGWLLGLGLLTGLFTVVPGLLPRPEHGTPVWAAWVRIAIGAVLIGFGLYRWITQRGEPHELPGMRHITDASPRRLFLIAAVLTAANPKVLFMCLAAGLLISAENLGAATPWAVFAFVLAAGSTVLLPTLAYLVAGQRLDPPLTRLRAWLERHSTALVAATLILIGAHMLYKGISHL